MVTSKNYDYLNQKDNEFDHDYDEFISKTDALKEHIGSTIEETFADIWETRHGYKFLIRFEKVRTSFLAKIERNIGAILIYTC